MKTSRLILSAVVASFLLLLACQRSASDELIAFNKKENSPAITNESFSAGTEALLLLLPELAIPTPTPLH